MCKFSLLLVAIFLSLNVSAQVTFTWKGNNYDHKADLEQTIKQHPNSVIVFEVGKTYLFKSIVNVYEKVTLNGKSLNKTGTVLKYDVAVNQGEKKGNMFRLHKSGVVFKNMTLNGNNKVKMALVDVNHQANATFSNVLFINSEDGIAAYNGKSCPGMVVKNCEFTKVTKNCIFVVNRNHNKVKLTSVAAFTIEKNVFNEGYSGGVIMDCGNDFYQVSGTKGGKRHEFATDFKGSRIIGNTFKKCKAWHVGGVQASNVIIHNNVMEGPLTLAQGANNNSTCFHFEQFTRNITISSNIMKNSSNNTSSKFIDMAGREGRRRWSNNPLIVYMKGVGGVGNTASDVRGDNCLSADPDNLTCKKTVHLYGPRNVFIFDNTFTVPSGKINSVIAFHDGENINIGLNSTGVTMRNTYTLTDNNLNKARVAIGKGDKGNCQITIKDNLNSGGKQVNISNGAAMAANCIQVAKKAAQISNNGEQLGSDGFKFNNPATGSLTIFPQNNNAYTIEVFLLSGRKMMEYRGQGERQIPISNLDASMYLIRYSTQQFSSTKKLLVQ